MEEKLTDKEYLGVTVPFMLSTMTQPLMGVVNTAVMGRMPDPKYIAAVALGAILFNNIYWFFGFLRVSTSGYAAQALGAGDRKASGMSFFRPLAIALVVSLCCILLQTPIVDLYLRWMAPEADVAALCRVYYRILVWGAPLVLFNYVSLGWLMGQMRIRASVFMQVSSNVLNMALSLWFVFGLGMAVEGVAWATLLSQIYGALVGAWLMRIHADFDWRTFTLAEILEPRTLGKILTVNANLMIRTACLLTVNNIIAAVGTSFGTVVLAANAVLFQIKDIISFLIDGMANGAAIFSGRALGKKSRKLLEETLGMTYRWLAVMVVLLAAGMVLGGDYLIRCLTDIRKVVAAAEDYTLYVVIYPFLAGMGLALYGLYTGTTFTAPVRNMMVMSLGVFWLAQELLVPRWGNDGLWVAFLLFYLSQSVILFIYLGMLRKRFDRTPV